MDEAEVTDVTGILTLENVIESILKIDILDERDRAIVMKSMEKGPT
jgi:CBS domain containing-hemolysin-like protein